MENLYTLSKLLSRDEFARLEDAFQNAWSEDIRFPELDELYTEDNKSRGMCTPTSLVVLDLYGGQLVYDKKNFHIWNELPDGTWQDFTRTQFPDNKIFSLHKYLTKEQELAGEVSQRTQGSQRYMLLKARVLKLLEEIK